MVRNSFGYTLTYLFALTLGAFGDLTSPFPQNKAVLLGTTNVVLNCSATTDYISWRFTPAGSSSYTTINFGPTVLNDAYVIDRPTGANQANLIIKRANESMAGTYICIESTYTASAQLIVISSGPTCTSNVSASTELYQGQSVQMSCSISYFANHPIVNGSMVWSTGSSPMANNPTPTYSFDGNETTATSTISQVAGYSNAFPIYQCNTTFTVNGSPPAAANIPDYSNVSVPFSTPIKVIYLKKLCSIQGAQNGDRVYLGANITCVVDANPEANYSWFDNTYSNTTNASIIFIWHDGKYDCTAWNKAGDCQTSINLTTYITTTTSTTTTTPTTKVTSPAKASGPGGNQSPGDQTAPSEDSTSGSGGLTEQEKNIIIGVVVGVGGAIIIVVVAIIIWCCIKKKKVSDRYKEDRNLKPMADYPPPYDGRVGPQRISNPDVVDYNRPASNSPSPHSPYGSTAHPYVVDDGLNYAQIQLDNQPRSRQPLQMPDYGNYVDVKLA